MLLAFIVIFMMFGLIAVYTYVSYASMRPKRWDDLRRGYRRTCRSGRNDERPGDGSGQQRDGKTGKTGIEVEVNGSVVTTTLAEVGYTFSAEEFLDEAMKVGRRGNLIENYKEIKEVRKTEFPLG